MKKLIFQQLMPYIRPFKGKIIGSLLFSFILAGIGGAYVSLVKPIFDEGLDPSTSKEDVYFLAAKLLALALINFPARYLHFYWLRYVMDRATCSVREEIFRKVQFLPASFFSTNKQGDLISNVLNDSQVFAQGFKALIDLVREPLKAAVFLSMAVYADWQLTMVIFVIAPFWVVIFGISGRKVRDNQSSVQENFGELTHDISEGLGAHKVIKAFNLQKYIAARFARTQNLFFESQRKTTIVEEVAHPFVEFVGAVAFAGVIVFAHHRVVIGAMTRGDFVAFIAALALFMDPIRKFSQANVKLGQARAAADRIFKLLDLEEERSSGKSDSPKFTSSIEVKDINFSYDGKTQVLSDFSMSIEKGQKVGLVGLSGSGKSTLLNLLLGLYPLKNGSISVDGTSIQDIHLERLREYFGLVSQDVFLFNDTIKENLLLGQDFEEGDVSKSLEVAYAQEFIDKMDGKLDSVIGDRGTLLSGGQKQRLTIARAFLRNSDILLFDEATSALDNESEKVVQKALHQLGEGKTVIAVAHRLSTIQDFDQIYVLNEGRVVEAGKHQQLLDNNGEYAKLYALGQK